MSTAVLGLGVMGRKPHDAPPPSEDEKAPYKRVPARMSEEEHDALREYCLIKLRKPIEVVIGRWVVERLAQEKKKPAPK